jgi:hypothetical protein
LGDEACPRGGLAPNFRCAEVGALPCLAYPLVAPPASRAAPPKCCCAKLWAPTSALPIPRAFGAPPLNRRGAFHQMAVRGLLICWPIAADCRALGGRALAGALAAGMPPYEPRRDAVLGVPRQGLAPGRRAMATGQPSASSRKDATNQHRLPRSARASRSARAI